MAKFKCKQSGNVFEFKLEHDIKTMRTHTAYEEIVEEDSKEEQEESVKRTYKPKVK